MVCLQLNATYGMCGFGMIYLGSDYLQLVPNIFYSSEKHSFFGTMPICTTTAITSYSPYEQARMAGESSFLTTLEVGVGVVEVVVVVLEVLIWSATSVVSLVILLVNAVCVLVQEDVVVAVPPDIGEAQAMVEGELIWDIFLFFI